MNEARALGGTFFALLVIVIGLSLTVAGSRKRGNLMLAALKP